MNLANVQRLLDAAEGAQPVHLKIDDPEAQSEVQLMAEVGLVEATLGDGQDGSFTVVHHLTDVGVQFLRALKESHPTAGKLRADPRYAARRQSAQREVIKKWDTKFALDFHWPHRTD